jgi:hypothetical protein
MVFPNNGNFGAVAQLEERLNGIQEVDGSIPFGSTNLQFQVKNEPLIMCDIA